MNKNRKPKGGYALTNAVLKLGGQLYEAEYILGTLLPKDIPVSSRVKAAKIIWDNGGTVEDVVSVFTH